jgi:hypothetical protein
MFFIVVKCRGKPLAAVHLDIEAEIGQKLGFKGMFPSANQRKGIWIDFIMIVFNLRIYTSNTCGILDFVEMV